MENVIEKKVIVRKKYNKATIPIIQEFNRLYELGYTEREIATRMDFCCSTVSHYIWMPRSKNQICQKRREMLEVIKNEGEVQVILAFIKVANAKKILNKPTFYKLSKLLFGDFE